MINLLMHTPKRKFGGEWGVLHAQNFEFCLKIGPKIIVQLQKISD